MKKQEQRPEKSKNRRSFNGTRVLRVEKAVERVEKNPKIRHFELEKSDFSTMQEECGSKNAWQGTESFKKGKKAFLSTVSPASCG